MPAELFGDDVITDPVAATASTPPDCRVIAPRFSVLPAVAATDAAPESSVPANACVKLSLRSSTSWPPESASTLAEFTDPPLPIRSVPAATAVVPE